MSDAVPFAESLCHRCVNKHDVRTKNSWFLRCAVLPQKYPPQPVRVCALFVDKPSELPLGVEPTKT